MKKEVSTSVIAAVVVVALLVVAGIGFYIWRAPSVTPAQGVDARNQLGPRAGGGGPTAEDLKRRDEYYRTHPDAKGAGR